jgi:hypothetical protein
MANRLVSTLPEGEFFDHRVRKQFTSKLSDPGQGVLIRWAANFDLERLALADAYNVRVPKSLACTRDCRTLWIVNLGFERHVNDDPAHSSALSHLGCRHLPPAHRAG